MGHRDRERIEIVRRERDRDGREGGVERRGSGRGGRDRGRERKKEWEMREGIEERGGEKGKKTEG